MDYKKLKIENTTITRNVEKIFEKTGNYYESVSIISKRANQISLEMKEELLSKLSDFASNHDNLEEIFENREQIEMSRFYERLPKPTLIAINEFVDDKVYFKKKNTEPID
ncbi:MAG: RNA polymerase Rpb6 [Bacteroidetes bacterium GWE2_29_8]|nr:MAG: RNA polymerase Rpb6 [Bacteroidetes bacterium GWE2_29_8]OFY21319.1 MAG: RNA polymerase Rpb6 [Bacteroidetes bacterium GWF2_29_10]